MKLKTFNELPNQKDIRDIVKLIRDYTFPNFFRESPNRDIVKKSIAKLYMKIVSDDSSLLDFVEQLDDITLSLEKDLEFFYQSDPASKSYDEIVFTYPGFRAIFHYRIAHIFYNQNRYILEREILNKRFDFRKRMW